MLFQFRGPSVKLTTGNHMILRPLMLLTELIKPEHKASQDDKSNSEKLFYALIIFIIKTWKQFIQKSFYWFRLLQQLHLVLLEQTTLSRCFELFKHSITGQSHLTFFHKLRTQNRKKVNYMVKLEMRILLISLNY